MRLLLYGINYAPELTGVGKYTGEMAEWLSAQGHEVRVITAPPYYPTWKVGVGFSAGRYQREYSKGIKVWRCPLWVPQKPSGLKRLLHLASFALSSLPMVLGQALFWHPDVVIVMEPPFFCVVGAWLAARLSGAKAWLHIQDFELDAAFELGLLPPSGPVRSLATRLERWLMSGFDRISTISSSMMDRLKMKGIHSSKCVFFPNWVDTQKIYPLDQPSSLREELQISSDTIVALYAGNMGEKQGLEILVAAAQLLETHSNILFIFCGEGTARSRLWESAQGLSNVRFLGLQPGDRLNDLLNLANIHLLPQRLNTADLVMPSKLQGMFASGRPVIATAHPDTQISQIVRECGIVVSPENVTALADAILDLATHSARCMELGQAARKFAVKHWHREAILRQFEIELFTVASLPIRAPHSSSSS